MALRSVSRHGGTPHETATIGRATPTAYRQTIYKMLHNRVYLGEIVHKGLSFPGQHQAIVTQGLWDVRYTR